MIDVKRIIPECNADILLVELILQRGRPGHRNGISKVATALENIEDNVRFSFGLVDNDKFINIPKYLKKFIIKEDKKKMNKVYC